MTKDRCLILFVKYPENGQVKTRLAKYFDEKFVVTLYENFIFDILESIEHGHFRLQILFSPPEKEIELKKLLGIKHYYKPQYGTNLGERMKNAFTWSFAQGFKSVILMGSDCPDLPASIIEDAFQVLETQADAVVGPSTDGGYYLIGFKSDTFYPEVFNGIPWSTGTVLENTMNILNTSDHLTKLGPVWRDIDNIDDLIDLVKRSQDTPFAHSRTMLFLKKRQPLFST